MRTTTLSLRALALLGAGFTMLPQAALAQSVADEGDLVDNADVDDGAPVIVVTAQGREQVLADVPVAISAVSSETLENSGTSDIRELNQIAPSLLVSSTGNEANGSARIRGIGTVGDNPGLESSVAVFVDGVYRSRSGNALSELGPLDRIEILRGPQGTLGGRNSSAGMISIYTAKPEFDFGGYADFTYGNYDAIRVEGGVNAPLGETIAARIDGVYFERDGFYDDRVNDVKVNNRDRYLVRAQALFEPNDNLSVRLVGDYSKKEEACCAATFVQPEFAPLARVSPGLDSFARPQPGAPGLTDFGPGGNPIAAILVGLGNDPRALTQSTFDRDIYMTPGRSFEGETEDYGVSGELNYDLGAANLTSITAYREYSNFQGSDTDYTQLDILYRTPGENAGAREFGTFTQELRLNGQAFGDRLDWLVGGFYANEKLEVRDNLRFGNDYGQFVSCRLAIALQPSLGATLQRSIADPTQANCFDPVAFAVIQSGAVFGPATARVVPALNNLAGLGDLGGTGDVYNQTSESFAVFTHNIFHITDNIDLTLGARYTTETKDFDASFGNDNTVCPANRALLGPIAGASPFFAGALALSCQGNSTSELDGVSLTDSRDEDEFTGTAILSWKPADDVMIYGSYSRGYKAGGFNLDRSALGNPVTLDVSNLDPTTLQFDEETVDAYELGVKYSNRQFSAGLTAFRQEFSNFQLNTFNGSVFLVQNINGCDSDLGGGDRDASPVTGTCDEGDIGPGVISEGFEFETSLSPTRNVNMTMGITYADTRYTDNLVGSDQGAPLDPALRLLPGDNLSNAPKIVATTSFTWTPNVGNSGVKGLLFVNARTTGDYNTGSDLLYGKEQDGYTLVNARVGFTNIMDRFSIEGWVQNLFDIDYTQVAFNTPFVAPQQTYSAFLAEPSTYGVTLRAEF